MRAKFLNEFVRGGDPLNTLGIGRVATIQKCFRDIGISDDRYEITPTEVIVNSCFDLSDTTVTWLPDGLTIKDTLYLNTTKITKLPNNLKIGFNLWLTDTPITKLPDDLYVHNQICVRSYQKELIAFIKDSKFANKLRFIS